MKKATLPNVGNAAACMILGCKYSRANMGTFTRMVESYSGQARIIKGQSRNGWPLCLACGLYKMAATEKTSSSMSVILRTSQRS
jgi:hypothetical protein